MQREGDIRDNGKWALRREMESVYILTGNVECTLSLTQKRLLKPCVVHSAGLRMKDSGSKVNVTGKGVT